MLSPTARVKSPKLPPPPQRGSPRPQSPKKTNSAMNSGNHQSILYVDGNNGSKATAQVPPRPSGSSNEPSAAGRGERKGPRDGISEFWTARFGHPCAYDSIPIPGKHFLLRGDPRCIPNDGSKEHGWTPKLKALVTRKKKVKPVSEIKSQEDETVLFDAGALKKEEEAVLSLRAALIAVSRGGDPDAASPCSPHYDSAHVGEISILKSNNNRKGSPSALLNHSLQSTLEKGRIESAEIGGNYSKTHIASGASQSSMSHIHPDLAALSLFSSPAIVAVAKRGASAEGLMTDSEAEDQEGLQGGGDQRFLRIETKKTKEKRSSETRTSVLERKSTHRSIIRRDFSFYSLSRRNQAMGRPSSAHSESNTMSRKQKLMKYYNDYIYWGYQNDVATEDEVKTFKVGDFVEARYRGYGDYLNGRVLAVWPNGTYHIHYTGSDKEETSVSPDLIRRRRVNARAKFKVGHLLMSLMGKARAKDSQVSPSPVSPCEAVGDRNLFTVNEDSGSEDDNEDGSSHGELEGEEPHLLDTDASGPSSVGSRQPRASVTISMQAAALTVSRLQLVSAGKLRSVDKNASLVQEKSGVQKRDEELVERARLWEELKRVVRMNNCELDINDIMVRDLIGNGKFAAVHKGSYYIYHTNVDPLDVHGPPLSHALPASSGAQQYEEEANAMRAIMPLTPFEVQVAVKTPRYVGAPALPSTYKSQVRLSHERVSSAADSTRDALEKADDPGSLPPSRIILEYLREIKVLQVLRHENIMNAYGMVLRPRLAIVMPLMDGLNLAQHIASEEWQASSGYLARLGILLGIVSGVAHMHEAHYIHRDIKPHNVMLSVGAGGVVPKLGDFGSSLRMPNLPYLTEVVGTSGYTAPEMFDPQRYSLPADVFSTAVLGWEIMSRRKPDNPLCGHDPDVYVELTRSGLRPSFGDSRGQKGVYSSMTSPASPQPSSYTVSSHAPEALRALLSQAWAQSPEERVTARAMQKEIARLVWEASKDAPEE